MIEQLGSQACECASESLNIVFALTFGFSDASALTVYLLSETGLTRKASYLIRNNLNHPRPGKNNIEIQSYPHEEISETSN